MPSLNRVMLMGNLTRDVELRFTTTGAPVANGGIAVNRRWKNEAGEKKEEVCFLDFVAWSRTAESLSTHTKKGTAIYLEGFLKFETWDDDGHTRSKHFLQVETFQFLEPKAPEPKTSPAEKIVNRREGGKP